MQEKGSQPGHLNPELGGEAPIGKWKGPNQNEGVRWVRTWALLPTCTLSPLSSVLRL